MAGHYGLNGADLEEHLGNHIVELGSAIGFFEEIGNDRVKDVFGVVWDRSQDRDIGIVEGTVLSEPTLEGYTFPDPLDPSFFRGYPKVAATVSGSVPALHGGIFVV